MRTEVARALHRSGPTCGNAAARQTVVPASETISTHMTTPTAGTLPLAPKPPIRRDRAWATGTSADASDTLPGDLDALGRHVNQGARGPWFHVGVASESVRSFLAPRIVTVLVAAGLVVAAVSILL